MGVPSAFVDQLKNAGLSFAGVGTAWASEATDIKDAGNGLSLVQFLPFGEFTAHAQGFRVVVDSIPAIMQVSAAVGESLIDYEHNSVWSWDGIEFSSRAAGWLKAIHVTETGAAPDDERFSQVSSPGVWGAVQFTEQARGMIKAGEYRYFSPVFLHDDDGLVLGIVGGGLTNTPAIKGMRQLAAKRGSKGEDPMSEKTDWAKVAASAGLPNPGAIETADHFNAAIKAKEDAAVAAAEQAANARAEAAESEARKVKATQLIETGLASGALPAGTGDFWTEQAKTAAGMATLEGALAAAAAAKPQAAAAPVPESAKPTPPEPGVVSKQAPGLPTVASEPSVIMASEHLPAGINQLDGELARAEAAIVAARQLKGKPGFRQAALAAYQRQQGV